MGVMSLFNVLPNDTYYEQDDGVDYVIILSFVLQILYKFYHYRY